MTVPSDNQRYKQQIDPRIGYDRATLSGKAGTDGDLYYRAMTDWSAIAHGRDITLAEECLKLGTAYLESLDKLISLPAKQRLNENTGLTRLRAMEYRSLLMRDLEALKKFLGDGS